MSFVSETYSKPKLIGSKLFKHIINQQNNKVTYISVISTFIILFIKTHYKIIIGLLILFSLLFWRYLEVKNRQNKEIV